MGLPVEKFVIASNQNDILHRTLTTGIYSREKLKQTVSPSMDIQVASNFERLLLELYEGETTLVQNSMAALNEKGKFELRAKALKKLRNEFLSGTASEKETFKTIRRTLTNYGELVCPHTAVGLAVAKDLHEIDKASPMITLATAHPAKFPNSVEKSTNLRPELPERYSDLFLKNEIYTKVTTDLSKIKKIISERILV